MQCEEQRFVSQSESHYTLIYIVMISIVKLQAIIESNPMGVSLKGTLDSIDLGRRFAKQIGCGDDDVACIRGKVLILHNNYACIAIGTAIGCGLHCCC